MPLRTGDQQNQNQEDTQDETQNPDGTSESEQTNQPSDPPTNEKSQEYYDLLEKTVGDMGPTLNALRQQNQEMARQLKELGNKPPTQPTAPVKTEEEERADFFNNPRESFRKLMKEELEATVAPLRQQVAGIIGATTKDTVLNKVAREPKFAKHYANPLIKAHVDNVISQVADSGQAVDENIVRQAFIQVVGLYNMGDLPAIAGIDPSPPQNQNTGNDERINETGGRDREITPSNSTRRDSNMSGIPAHLRPSAPRGPSSSNNGKPQRRQLTENEKTVARQSRMTDEQYLDFLELSPASVATYSGDKPKDKENK